MAHAAAGAAGGFCNCHRAPGIGAPLHRAAATALGWGSLQWDGEGLEEVGRRRDTGAVVVRIDPRYFRPAEVETLLGDPTRAREKLGWTPSTSLEEMVNEMINHDREEARKEAYLKRKGFQVVGPRE